MEQTSVLSGYTGADHFSQINLFDDPHFRELQGQDNVLFANRDNMTVGKLVVRNRKVVYQKGTDAVVNLLKDRAKELGYL